MSTLDVCNLYRQNVKPNGKRGRKLVDDGVSSSSSDFDDEGGEIDEPMLDAASPSVRLTIA